MRPGDQKVGVQTNAQTRHHTRITFACRADSSHAATARSGLAHRRRARRQRLALHRSRRGHIGNAGWPAADGPNAASSCRRFRGTVSNNRAHDPARSSREATNDEQPPRHHLARDLGRYIIVSIFAESRTSARGCLENDEQLASAVVRLAAHCDLCESIVGWVLRVVGALRRLFPAFGRPKPSDQITRIEVVQIST